MDLSVILCTYNRCESLRRALDSLALSVVPETVEWELLVIDNNSNDRTRGIVEAFSTQHPGRCRYVFEPQQGKSFALNTGIRESRGKVLAFVDDDVTVERGWLDALTSPLYSGEWAGSGGRILPESGFVPPPWLALEGRFNQIGALCAYSNPGDLPGELKTPVVGANMAFRREMFDKYGLFRTDLGPRPGSELRYEDTEFGNRLVSGGERLGYVPSATVYHEIHQSRVRKEFFLAWWFEFGRGMVREREANLTPFEALKIFARLLLTGAEGLLSFNPQKRFYFKCRVKFDSGKLKEAFQRSHRISEKSRRRAESVNLAP